MASDSFQKYVSSQSSEIRLKKTTEINNFCSCEVITLNTESACDTLFQKFYACKKREAVLHIDEEGSWIFGSSVQNAAQQNFQLLESVYVGTTLTAPGPQHDLKTAGKTCAVSYYKKIKTY